MNLSSLLLGYWYSFQAKISLIPWRGDRPDLADAFETGLFEWNDFLIYGLYLIQLLLLFAGGQAIISILFSAYRIIFGSLVEDKEKGRDSLKHTFIGFGVVCCSWAGVDIVISLLT